MSVQRTALATYVQNCLYQNLPVVIEEFTTINERLNINQDIDIPPGQTPAMGWYIIGNGGHRVVSGGPIDITVAKVHRATDYALYNQVPFVMRRLNNDLSAAQRTNYALREVKEFNGEDWVFYWAKKIDLSQTVPTTKKTTIVNGVSDTDIFIPTNSNIYPEPPQLLADGSNPTDAESVHVDALTELLFDRFDRDEFINVAEQLYGDEKYAKISEMGILHGVSRQLSVPVNGGGTEPMSELISGQIAYHVGIDRNLLLDNEGFKVTLNLGGTDPMIVEQSPVVVQP